MLPGPVLLAALDGAPAPLRDAARLARLLAERTDGDVRVLASPRWAARLASARAGVRERVRRALPDGCDWPVTVADRRTDAAIARLAAESCAAVVVVAGGGRHVGERFARRALVMRLLRRTSVPVYVARGDADALARRVVLATDFGRHSVHAARLAHRLIAPDAEVTLAHVWPGLAATAAERTTWTRAYAQSLPFLFDRARRQIGLPDTMRIDMVTLAGPTAGVALVRFAAARRADLVVSATHGRGLLARLVLGSVSAEMLRRAPCSVLCVAGSAAGERDVETVTEAVASAHPVRSGRARLLG